MGQMDTEKQLDRTRRQALLRDLARLEPVPGKAGLVTVGEWVEYWVKVLGY